MRLRKTIYRQISRPQTINVSADSYHYLRLLHNHATAALENLCRQHRALLKASAFVRMHSIKRVGSGWHVEFIDSLGAVIRMDDVQLKRRVQLFNAAGLRCQCETGALNEIAKNRPRIDIIIVSLRKALKRAGATYNRPWWMYSGLRLGKRAPEALSRLITEHEQDVDKLSAKRFKALLRKYLSSHKPPDDSSTIAKIT